MRSTVSTPSPGWSACRTASRYWPRICCAPRTGPTSPLTMCGPWRLGIPRPNRARRSSSPLLASSCRTSPACPASSTWPLCARPWRIWGATLMSSIPWRPLRWSSTTLCRSTPSACPVLWSAIRNWSTAVTPSAISSCAGDRAPSPISGWFLRVPASFTRSISSTWRAPCLPRRSPSRMGLRLLRPTRTPAWAPTHTRPRSTAWACWAGEWAVSRPRRPCSVSRCPCSSRA